MVIMRNTHIDVMMIMYNALMVILVTRIGIFLVIIIHDMDIDNDDSAWYDPGSIVIMCDAAMEIIMPDAHSDGYTAPHA